MSTVPALPKLPRPRSLVFDPLLCPSRHFGRTSTACWQSGVRSQTSDSFWRVEAQRLWARTSLRRICEQEQLCTLETEMRPLPV